MYYVYILQGNSNPPYYIGFTSDLRARFEQHNEGRNVSTVRGRPWTLLYYEAYIHESAARKREYVLKQYGKAWQVLKRRILS